MPWISQNLSRYIFPSPWHLKKTSELKGKQANDWYLCSYLILAWSPLPPVRIEKLFLVVDLTQKKSNIALPKSFRNLKSFPQKGQTIFYLHLKISLLSTYCTFTLSHHRLLLSALQLTLTYFTILTVHGHTSIALLFFTLFATCGSASDFKITYMYCTSPSQFKCMWHLLKQVLKILKIISNQDWLFSTCTVKKGFAVFPSPAGMSLTKLFIDGNMFPLLSLKFSLSQVELSQNPFESVSVPVHRQKFSRIFLFSRREFFQDLW